MKTYIHLITIAVFLILGNTEIHAAKKKAVETKFKVEGVCNMCKKRIENAALIKGVKLAEWDKKTKELKVIYLKEKTSPEAIQKSIALTGHDVGKFKAKLTDYEKLPDCCAYRDGVKTH